MHLGILGILGRPSSLLCCLQYQHYVTRALSWSQKSWPQFWLCFIFIYGHDVLTLGLLFFLSMCASRDVDRAATFVFFGVWTEPQLFPLTFAIVQPLLNSAFFFGAFSKFLVSSHVHPIEAANPHGNRQMSGIFWILNFDDVLFVCNLSFFSAWLEKRSNGETRTLLLIHHIIPPRAFRSLRRRGLWLAVIVNLISASYLMWKHRLLTDPVSFVHCYYSSRPEDAVSIARRIRFDLVANQLLQ